MIKKIVSTSITDGRRNKQQILKDFVRPSPASTISSPAITTGPYSGNIPGCAAPEPIRQDSCGTASDGFDRVVAAGWGGNDSLTWHYLCDAAQAMEIPDLASAHLTGCNTAYVSNGGVLQAQPFSSSSWTGAYLAARIPYDTIDETSVVLYKLVWLDTGGISNTQSGHTLYFTARGPDDRVPETIDLQSDRVDTLIHSGSYAYSNGVLIEWNRHVSPVNIIRCFGSGGISTTIDPIIEGEVYCLEITSDAHSTQALWWQESEGKETAVSCNGSRPISQSTIVYPPYLGILLGENIMGPTAPNPENLSATVVVKRVVVNGGAAAGDCLDPSYEPGYYLETLVNKGYYWQPQNTDVSYYNQVYFDGVPVFKDTHYTIEDTYKIVPNRTVDSGLPEDTVVTAQVVRE